MTELEQKISHIETDLAAAFNRRDIDALLAYFDEDLVGFSSTKHERLFGLEALRRTFHYYLEQSERVAFHLSEIIVHTYGQVAISTFYWTVAIHSGDTQHDVHGRGSHVFVERNGEWKIVHEHFSRAHRRPELWDTSPD